MILHLSIKIYKYVYKPSYLSKIVLFILIKSKLNEITIKTIFFVIILLDDPSYMLIFEIISHISLLKTELVAISNLNDSNILRCKESNSVEKSLVADLTS